MNCESDFFGGQKEIKIEIPLQSESSLIAMETSAASSQHQASIEQNLLSGGE